MIVTTGHETAVVVHTGFSDNDEHLSCLDSISLQHICYNGKIKIVNSLVNSVRRGGSLLSHSACTPPAGHYVCQRTHTVCAHALRLDQNENDI